MFQLFFLGLLYQTITSAPISLHPSNPHYFSYQNKSTVLVTSGEHYGAVLNDEFDYKAYLDSLANAGLTLTRLFPGIYREYTTGNLEGNTLAPADNHFIAPWARSSTCCYIGGGNLFDVSNWDPAYFTRLTDFISYAGSKGIIVEITLFSVYYGDDIWAYSPLNGKSNINNIGVNMSSDTIWNMQNTALQTAFESYVKKIVTALSSYDNVYYELMNEPSVESNVTMMENFMNRIADVINSADTANPHLIAEFIRDYSGAWVITPNSHVSIIDFHYANSGTDASWGWSFSRASSDDETGFAGNITSEYRAQAWSFFACGGAVFDNLDYSYTVANPDGTAILTQWQMDGSINGGGGPQLRGQLVNLLKFFMETQPNGVGLGGDFIRFAPSDKIITSSKWTPTPSYIRLHALGTTSAQAHFFIYASSAPDPYMHSLSLSLTIPVGKYQGFWIDPSTGKQIGSTLNLSVDSGNVTLSQLFNEDVVLQLKQL